MFYDLTSAFDRSLSLNSILWATQSEFYVENFQISLTNILFCFL